MMGNWLEKCGRRFLSNLNLKREIRYEGKAYRC